EAWHRNGGSAIFVSAETTAALEARIAAEGFQTVRIPVLPGTSEDAAQSAEIAATQNASWVVADSYKFGLDYQRDIQAAGLRPLFIDDFCHAGEYAADFVLDQNLAVRAALYKMLLPGTRLFLGPPNPWFGKEFYSGGAGRAGIPELDAKVLAPWGAVTLATLPARRLEACRVLELGSGFFLAGINLPSVGFHPAALLIHACSAML